MIDDLFKFPVVMVDSRNEEEKYKENERLGLPASEEEEDLDVVTGEAEYPYFDFIGVEDRWMPDKPSFKKAMKGKFNACLVKFANIGMLLVPWTKEKFKEELTAFIKIKEEDKEEEEPKKVTVIKFTPEMLANMLKSGEEVNKEDNG